MNARFALSYVLIVGLFGYLAFYQDDLNSIYYCLVVGSSFYLIEFMKRMIFGPPWVDELAPTKFYFYKSKWLLLNKLNFLMIYLLCGVVFFYLEHFMTDFGVIKHLLYFWIPDFIIRRIIVFLKSRHK